MIDEPKSTPELPAVRKAVAYLRVSTDQQETERQRYLITRWAECANVIIAHCIEEPEGISGRAGAIKKSPAEALRYFSALAGEDYGQFERVGFGELLRLVKAREVSLVVLSDLDRASRSTIELLLLDLILSKYGSSLAVVGLGGAFDTATSSGKVMFRLLSLMAENECDRTSERTRSSLARKAAAGEFVGRPPVGWKVVKAMRGDKPVTIGFAHDPEEWPRVVTAAGMRGQGKKYDPIGQSIGRHTSRVKSYLDAHAWVPPNGLPILEDPAASADAALVLDGIDAIAVINPKFA